MKKHIEKIDIYFLILLIGVVCIHLSRIQLGYVNVDEGFYLTIPYRLTQGDALLADEWHVTQLVAMLVYPLVKMYLVIFKGTEGIYLAFRYLYVGFLIGTTLVSYLLLRKKDKTLAMISSIMFGLFTNSNIRNLSYNTIGMMALWLMVVLTVTECRHFYFKYILIGLLLAIVVLCNPYMLLLYFAYFGMCVWKREEKGIFGWKAFATVTVGASIMAVIFLAFVLSRTSLDTVLKSLPYIIADPAHPASKSIWDFFEPVVSFVVWFKWYFGVLLIGFLTAIFSKKYRKLSLIGMMMLSVLLWILLVIFKIPGIGKHAMMLPMTLIGGTLFILTKNKHWEWFYKGWMVGVIYAICMNLSSNQGIYVICNACTISSCASVFLIKDYFVEDVDWKNGIRWLWILAVVQIAVEACVSYYYIFWEEDNSLITEEIKEGPLKGIYTTKEKVQRYENAYSDIQNLGELKGKKIVFFNCLTTGYLMAPDAENGGFSAWMVENHSLDNERYKQYYIIHPEKIPDIIYVDERTRCEWTDEEWTDWCIENGYEMEKLQDHARVLRRQVQVK